MGSLSVVIRNVFHWTIKVQTNRRIDEKQQHALDKAHSILLIAVPETVYFVCIYLKTFKLKHSLQWMSKIFISVVFECLRSWSNNFVLDCWSIQNELNWKLFVSNEDFLFSYGQIRWPRLHTIRMVREVHRNKWNRWPSFYIALWNAWSIQ